MSGPNGSIKDLRNVFPFISFVVAITNSTNAAKEGKQYKVLKLLLLSSNTYDQARWCSGNTL
jgi:hypothetical protein